MYRHVYLPLNVHFSMKIKRFFSIKMVFGNSDLRLLTTEFRRSLPRRYKRYILYMVWIIPNLKPLVKDLAQPTKCSAMLSTGYQLDTQLLQGTFSIQH
jgi:hypothetical protein